MKWLLCLLVLFHVVAAANAWRFRWWRWRKKTPPAPPCNPVDGTWTDWSEVRSCPTCNSTWPQIRQSWGTSMRVRSCKGRECGGKACVGNRREFLPCPALNASIDDVMGEWRVKQNCTGERYRVERKIQRIGWFWRGRWRVRKVTEILPSATCISTDDPHPPKSAYQWIHRDCEHGDRCGGCPPAFWPRYYERKQPCVLPMCEEPTTESPETPTPELVETPTPEEVTPSEEILVEETAAPTPEEEVTPSEEIIVEETTAPTPEEEVTPSEEIIIVEETIAPPTPGLPTVVIDDNGLVTEPVVQEPTRGDVLPVERRSAEDGPDFEGMLRRVIESEVTSVREERQKIDGLLAKLAEAEKAAAEIGPDIVDEQEAEEEVREMVSRVEEEVKEDLEEKVEENADEEPTEN